MREPWEGEGERTAPRFDCRFPLTLPSPPQGERVSDQIPAFTSSNMALTLALASGVNSS